MQADTAPNLSAVLGSEVAARLMGVAGGLIPLSKMPACNVQVLGAKRKTMAGFSSAAAVRSGDLHAGFIFQCDVIQKNTPPALRSRAARLIGGKCTLMARVDAFGEDPSVSGFSVSIMYELFKNLVMCIHDHDGFTCICCYRAQWERKCMKKLLKKLRNGRSLPPQRYNTNLYYSHVPVFMAMPCHPKLSKFCCRLKSRFRFQTLSRKRDAVAVDCVQ